MDALQIGTKATKETKGSAGGTEGRPGPASHEQGEGRVGLSLAELMESSMDEAMGLGPGAAAGVGGLDADKFEGEAARDRPWH